MLPSKRENLVVTRYNLIEVIFAKKKTQCQIMKRFISTALLTRIRLTPPFTNLQRLNNWKCWNSRHRHEKSRMGQFLISSRKHWNSDKLARSRGLAYYDIIPWCKQRTPRRVLAKFSHETAVKTRVFVNFANNTWLRHTGPISRGSTWYAPVQHKNTSLVFLGSKHFSIDAELQKHDETILQAKRDGKTHVSVMWAKVWRKQKRLTLIARQNTCRLEGLKVTVCLETFYA